MIGVFNAVQSYCLPLRDYCDKEEGATTVVQDLDYGKEGMFPN